MSMSRKDYEAFGQILADSWGEVIGRLAAGDEYPSQGLLADDLATTIMRRSAVMFASDNARFDAGRFCSFVREAALIAGDREMAARCDG